VPARRECVEHRDVQRRDRQQVGREREHDREPAEPGERERAEHRGEVRLREHVYDLEALDAKDAEVPEAVVERVVELESRRDAHDPADRAEEEQRLPRGSHVDGRGDRGEVHQDEHAARGSQEEVEHAERGERAHVRRQRGRARVRRLPGERRDLRPKTRARTRLHSAGCCHKSTR